MIRNYSLDKNCKEIGSSIRKHRIKKQLSQIKLSELLSISQTHMSNIETGKVYPTPKMLIKISKLLKCSMNELFGLD